MPKKDIENSNIFVFGDKMTGKRALFKVMNRSVFQDDEDQYKRLLQIDENSAKFGLLDYTYISIKNTSDEDSEVIGKMNVWIMNDFIDKDKILKFLKPENIINSICLIIADLSRPWLIKQSGGLIPHGWIKSISTSYAVEVLTLRLPLCRDICIGDSICKSCTIDTDS